MAYSSLTKIAVKIESSPRTIRYIITDMAILQATSGINNLSYAADGANTIEKKGRTGAGATVIDVLPDSI